MKSAKWKVNGNAIHDYSQGPNVGKCVAIFEGEERHTNAQFVFKAVLAFEHILQSLEGDGFDLSDPAATIQTILEERSAALQRLRDGGLS